jgi:hypothetical protein
VLVGINVQEKVVYVKCRDIYGNEWDDFRKVSYDKFTPILRPLSGLTEQECIKANSFGKGGLDLDENLKGYYTNTACFFDPEEFKYLLSIGIDLFGLIPAGLAIDKTTLQTQNNG